MTGLTGTSYTDTGLSNGTYYTYQVAAVNGVGRGTLSNLVYVTPNTTPSITLPAVSITGTGSNNQATLTWNMADQATSYNLYRSTTSGGEGNAPYVTGLSPSTYMQTYNDVAVSNGTTYYYQVTPVNNTGEGAYSNEIAVQPPNPLADFLLYLGPPVITIARGTTAGVNAGIYLQNSFTGAVTVTMGTTPAGVSGTLFPSVCPAIVVSSGVDAEGPDISFCVSPTAVPGSYYVILTGTSGSSTHTLTIHLIIT